MPAQSRQMLHEHCSASECNRFFRFCVTLVEIFFYFVIFFSHKPGGIPFAEAVLSLQLLHKSVQAVCEMVFTVCFPSETHFCSQ